MAKHGSGVGLMKDALRNLNPWKVIQEGDGFFVVQKGTGKKVHDKPHPDREAANKHMAALYAAEGAGKAEGSAVKSKSKGKPDAESSPAKFRK